MRGPVLVDAGPLVAILHRSDDEHEACVAALGKLRAPLLTTWPPMTEAMYLLEFSRPAQHALLQFVERGAVSVCHLNADDLPAIRKLMDKYEDLPMDFADATLVHLANRENTRAVFTLDRRDFSVYRTQRGRTFEIVP